VLASKKWAPANGELCRLLRQDPAHYVRASCGDALGAIRDTSSIFPLCEATTDGHTRVRERAVLALGRYTNEEAVPELVRILAEEEKTARTGAIDALAGRKDKRSVTALIEFLASDEMAERRRSAISLSKLTGRRIDRNAYRSIAGARGVRDEWRAWWHKAREEYVFPE
jgi:HEAT repeat protein